MKTVVHCAGCDRPIMDRFIFNVLDLAWHAKCVKCADCKCHLTEKCFSREGKLYCRQDFFRRYGTKCSGCSQGISPNDLVRRAKNKVFHLKCFTCMVCRKQLSTGEELYVLDENKFICKDDYMNTRSSSVNLNSPEDQGELSDGDGSEPGSVLNHGPTDSDGGGSSGLQDGLVNGPLNGSSTTVLSADKDSSVDGEDSVHDQRDNGTPPDDGTVGAGGKRRGPRTTIKAKQLETLKAAFAATPKPTRHIREQLAQETGLNMRVIQVWFQNRRSKERRMKQLSTMGARRNFYRNPRRMRALRPGMSPDGSCVGAGSGGGLDDPDMHHSGHFAYFADGGGQGDIYGGQPFYDFFPGQQPGLGHPGHHANGPPDGMLGFQQTHLPPTSIEQPVPPGGPLAPGSLGLNHHDGHFLSPDMMVSQRNSSPDSVLNVSHVTEGGGTQSRSLSSSSVDNFASPPSLTHSSVMAETPVW